MSSVDVAIRVPWPAGRARPRRPARRRVNDDLQRAGIGAWSWTLFCIGLAVIAWELPFFEPSCGMSQPALALPSARHGGDLELGPIITVDASSVTLDGRRSATPGEIRARGLDALTELQADLATLHRNWDLLHPREPFPGSVILSASPDVDWAVLQSVLLAAALAEYPDVQFAVWPEERASPPFDWARFEALGEETGPVVCREPSP
jgi:hypothetical protein